jgi:hypothetical protein
MYTQINRISIVESCVSAIAKSEDPMHRRLSLLVLRLIRDEYTNRGEIVFEAAEKALKKDPSAEVRKLSAWILGDFSIPASLNSLIDALADENWEVRFEVVEALAALAFNWDYYNGDADDEDEDEDDNDDNDDEKNVKHGEEKEVMDDGSHYVKSAITGLLKALQDNRPEVSLRAAFRLSNLNPCKVRSEIKKILPECTEFYS